MYLNKQTKLNILPFAAHKAEDRVKKWECRAGDMAQLVECLPSKYKALGSNPSTIIKKGRACSLSYIFFLKAGVASPVGLKRGT